MLISLVYLRKIAIQMLNYVKSTLYSFLYVKEILARSRREVWSLKVTATGLEPRIT